MQKEESMKPGLVVLYRWRLYSGMEDSFIRAWSTVTELLLARGSFGSRLHKGPEGLWYGYAQWPSNEARLAAFATPVDSDATQQMSKAIDERFPEILLDCVADYLVLPSQTESSQGS
jgi:hypothetical protein